MKFKLDENIGRRGVELLEVTTAPPRNREAEAQKARARAAVRFARPAGGAA